MSELECEPMSFDVLIIGAGPAGLSAAIRLAQLAKQHQRTFSICVLEKGSEVGAHILSGAVLEPKALNELIPDWQQLGAPLHTQATHDQFLFLTEQRAWRLPMPPQMKNYGNYIISLGNLCRWLAEQATKLGVEIFPGFPAKNILFDENGSVIGVTTTEMGVSKLGEKKPNYQPAIQLYAKQTLFAEGCHGSLSKTLIQKYNLREGKQPQTYGIGIKELWEIPKPQHNAGSVIHTLGWPLTKNAYGGTFIYHFDENLVSLGIVIGLDYQNPYLSPVEELQRFKHHPTIAKQLKGGRCIAYGARAINEGGWQSIPKLSFPGGLLIGCSAGFVNVPKIKGSHTAMKSGMVAAEAIFPILAATQPQEAVGYQQAIEQSWVGEELHKVRNIRPSFRNGLLQGLVYSAIDTYIFRGHAPWTFKHKQDHLSLKPANQYRSIQYPKPDGVLSFDRLTLVSLSNTNHEEDQPCHLQLTNLSIPGVVNLKEYAAPETRYCPAGVYEYNQGKLQINAQNCLHCKACDIKDPTQNINWVPPEGGGGPNYPNM